MHYTVIPKTINSSYTIFGYTTVHIIVRALFSTRYVCSRGYRWLYIAVKPLHTPSARAYVLSYGCCIFSARIVWLYTVRFVQLKTKLGFHQLQRTQHTQRKK